MSKKSFWRIFRKIVLKIIFWFFIVSISLVVMHRFVPVYFTPLMLKRAVENISNGKDVKFSRKWTPIENISHNAIQAVVASEDNLFMQHSGFDTKAIEKARKYNETKKAANKANRRGGSTITQQTAKNVFTFASRTWFRKGIETYYTLLIELIWGKKRIMEIYLNVVEFGDGIYGIEAASQHYFRHSAKTLNAPEAALLAASLPNPLRYSISNPGKYMRKRQSQIVNLMPKVPKVDFGKAKK